MSPSKTIADRPSVTRSRVTNGRRRFIHGDGRSVWARRWKDLTELHIADLGGVEKLSEAQISLCRRVSTIECELERMEGLLSKEEPIDFDMYNRLSGNLKRLYESIGIDRKAKDITPTLKDYLSRKPAPLIEGETS